MLRFCCSSLLFSLAIQAAAEDPSAALNTWHQQLADHELPAPTDMLADVGGQPPQAATLTALADKIHNREWDFRVRGSRQDGTLAMVVVEMVREKNADASRLTAFYLVDRNGWRWLLRSPHDPALTGLTAEERAASTRLDAWFATYQKTQTNFKPWQPAPIAAPIVSAAPQTTSHSTGKTDNSATPPAHAASTAKHEEEEDEVDPYLKAKIQVHPWTEIQRRSTLNTLLPSATPIKGGDFAYRIVHVAQEAYYENLKSNLLGLDDNVKLGLGLGYGITNNCDVWLQRSNGHDLNVNPSASSATQMDYYDLMGRYRILDQVTGSLPGIADAAILFGTTAMLRNQSKGDLSLNYGIMVERTFLYDRVRIGSGIFHAGLSAYERTLNIGPDNKIFPDEFPNLPPDTELPEKSTTAIPLNLKIAIDKNWQLFGESVFPIAGYRTHLAPTVATGFRFNTNTHEFSFYVTNSANTAFNGVITGGNTGLWNLPLFGFSITAFL